MTNALPNPEEQRRHSRRALQTKAQLILPGHRPFEIRTTDISMGGLGLVAMANPPLNLVVRVQFSLPMPGAKLLPMDVMGRVVHSVLSRRHGGFSIGLALNAPSYETLKAISAYMNG
jgi:hypothetical protein